MSDRAVKRPAKTPPPISPNPAGTAAAGPPGADKIARLTPRTTASRAAANDAAKGQSLVATPAAPIDKGGEPVPATRPLPANKPGADRPVFNVLPTRKRLASAMAKKPRRSLPLMLLVLVFLIPTTVVTYYFMAVASDQYTMEVQFAVRGSDTSPLASLGLDALPGVSSQHPDSYIVSDYLESVQFLRDALGVGGLDLRQFYARDDIDAVLRLDADIPLEEFLGWWRWHTNVEFNSVTGNTTFQVYAFTPDDAEAIGRIALKLSERLVNTLSSDSREKLIGTAREEVSSARDRLLGVRQKLQAFRNREQALDPEQSAKMQGELITSVEQQLISLRARRQALRATVDRSSPTLRVLEREIKSLERQLVGIRADIGSGSNEAPADGRNLSTILTDYTELALNEELATQSYTSALKALEVAVADARKQQRYLATYVAPAAPSIATHPRRFVYSLVAAFWFFILWAIILFVIRSVRDHAL